MAKAHVQRLDLEVLLKVSCCRERGRRGGEEIGLGLEREEEEVREEEENAVLSRPWNSTTLNSLTTVGYLLDVFIKLWIPSMARIFTSAWS